MKNVVWNLNRTIAIPVNNIKCFEIINTSNLQSTDTRHYAGWIVLCAYTICTGEHEVVFTSDKLADCEAFIENIYK